MKGLAAFLLGAIAGGVAVALLTPMTGEELRERIRMELRKRGIIAQEELEDLVDLIAAEVEVPAVKAEKAK